MNSLFIVPQRHWLPSFAENVETHTPRGDNLATSQHSPRTVKAPSLSIKSPRNVRIVVKVLERLLEWRLLLQKLPQKSQLASGPAAAWVSSGRKSPPPWFSSPSLSATPWGRCHQYSPRTNLKRMSEHWTVVNKPLRILSVFSYRKYFVVVYVTFIIQQRVDILYLSLPLSVG